MIYQIKVKSYMTKKATPEFDFMSKWNNNIPMPLRVMVGEKIQETPGMVKMSLHGDILADRTLCCMKCGKPITNEISQYFGMGPECGQHNYVNPFNTPEELHIAVTAYKKQLQNIKWEGWIIKSAIQEMTVIDDTVKDVQTEDKKSLNENIIDIRKSQSNTYDEQSAFISFKYDTELVELMRTLPIRFYHKETKEWEVPLDKIDYIKEHTNKTFKINGQLNKSKKECNYILKGFKFKTEPFSHQLDGFNYGLNHNKWLLGDEQGLGKTKQVIDIAVAKKIEHNYKHCLIVCCVNSLKWNWYNEINTHSDESSWILGMRFKNGKYSVKGNKEKLDDLKNLNTNDNYFIITNIESLRIAEISDEIKKLCKQGLINIIAVDEIHKCNNHTSQQSKGLLNISADVNIAMTGTPLMNRPTDLFLPLKWLGYETHSYYAFEKHYCIKGGYGGYEVVGYKNMDELQEKLNKIMLRRLKEEVLDLPDKIFIDEYVEMSSKQQKIYDEVADDIKSNIDRIKIAPNPLAQLIRLRQATGYTGILSTTIQESAKLDRLEQLIEDSVSNGKKVVVFSNWTQMTDVAYNRLRNYNPAIITGDTNINDRQHMVDTFQNDTNCKVIIGTIGAMGTGLTLTSGTVVIFLDEPWTKAAFNQAVDRCHRIGTKSNITVYVLMAKGTIDERIHEIVEKKGAMSDAIVDGKVMANQTELLDYLLS